jgi:excisionase family DNA binding protein
MAKALTPVELARLRGVTLDFIYKQLRTGRIPRATKAGKHWVIPQTAVKSAA